MKRSEKIMKKYGGAFGRFKALVFVLCGVLLIVSVGSLVYLFTEDVPSDDFVSLLAVMSIAVLALIIFMVFIFLQTLKKAKQNSPVSPVGLLFGMLYVGVATDFAVCAIIFKPFVSIFKVFMGGASSGTSKATSNFAQRYIRETDSEYFYLYSDCGDYAYLASESANATTVEVWPHSGGYVHDNSGRTYRAL